MTKCKHPIEIDIEYDEHDITIYDLKHLDNAVTMTKEEAKVIFEKLKNIL